MKRVTYDAIDASDGTESRIVIVNGNQGPFATFIQAKRYLVNLNRERLRAVQRLRKADCQVERNHASSHTW